jgi:hypothetical protein
MARRIEEVRILSEKTNELLGQTLMDADSIKHLNGHIRDLRKELADKQLKIIFS